MRIPVVWSGGQWRVQGTFASRFDEGTPGVVHVEGSTINTRGSKRKVHEIRRVFSLPAGTELRVAMTIRSVLKDTILSALVQAPTPCDATAKIGDRTRFVSVWPRGRMGPWTLKDEELGALSFVFKGDELHGVDSGLVELPSGLDFEQHEAESLNHAFTLLSEVFEPTRMSHTGNIYQQVFYEREGSQWGPLEELRVRAIQEHREQMTSC